MMFYMKLGSFLIITLILVSMTVAKTMGQQEKNFFAAPQIEVSDDDGSFDNALYQRLFARQMLNRFRSNLDSSEYQRKRSYWKQCAFNAVSCFGKK